MSLKKWMGLMALCVLTTINFGISQKVFASTGSDFTATRVSSEEQLDPDLSYFSFAAKTDHDYNITTLVENISTTETLDFEAKLVTATTSNYGKVNYLPSTEPKDKSLKIALPELLQQDQPVVQKFSIKPGEHHSVTYRLHTPETPILGTILGSVYIHRLTEESGKNKKMAFNNEFSMTLPVQIKNEDTKILPKLSLENITMRSSGGAAELLTAIHNSSPVLFGGIHLNAQLYKKGETKQLFSQTDKNLEMAPNSTMRYQMNTNGKTLDPGRYLLKMQLTSGKEHFNLAKEFTIEGIEERKINRQLLESNQKEHHYFWKVLCILLALTLLLLLFFLYKRNKQDKETKQS